MKVLLGLLVSIICVTCAAGQTCNVDAGFRGGRFNVYYEQRHLVTLFRSLNSLPPNVRGRLDDYLKTRLGSAFAKRLEFDEGQWLDIKELQKEFPALYEKNLHLGTYDLLFRFSDPAKGLKYFYAKLALNDDGSVNEDIKLPNIGKNPAKAEIISCENAIQIAVTHGFSRDRISPWFEYSPEHDSFIWVLTDSKRVDSGQYGNGTYRKIDVDANTGEILRTYKETIAL